MAESSTPVQKSLWSKYPDYLVDLEPVAKRMRVELDGETVIDTHRAVRVLETRHDPVYYFPREDARMELLERTEHHTFCPFKGEASYYSIRTADQLSENTVWTYESPFPEVAGLVNYLAFYEDRVQVVEA